MVEQTIEAPVILDANAIIMALLQWYNLHKHHHVTIKWSFGVRMSCMFFWYEIPHYKDETVMIEDFTDRTIFLCLKNCLIYVQTNSILQSSVLA